MIFLCALTFVFRFFHVVISFVPFLVPINLISNYIADLEYRSTIAVLSFRSVLSPLILNSAVLLGEYK